MKLTIQRKLAAKIFNVGVNRVFLDPKESAEIAKAITREDIKDLIRRGFISVKQKEGTSRSRAKKMIEQKKKGCRKGPGSRKGKKGARTPKKEKWIGKVRALRDELKKLREENKVDEKMYRRIYKQIKGNLFLSRRHLRETITKD